MIVEIADLGAWGGATLVSEYDPRDDAIRIDARAVATVRAVLGNAEAERFISVAIAHERYHRDVPHGTEAGAHARARDICGVDPKRYERVLQLARGERR